MKKSNKEEAPRIFSVENTIKMVLLKLQNSNGGREGRRWKALTFIS